MPNNERSEADILLESLVYLRFPSNKFKRLYLQVVNDITQDLAEGAYRPRTGAEEAELNPKQVFTQSSIDLLRSHMEDISEAEEAERNDEVVINEDEIEFNDVTDTITDDIDNLTNSKEEPFTDELNEDK